MGVILYRMGKIDGKERMMKKWNKAFILLIIVFACIFALSTAKIDSEEKEAPFSQQTQEWVV